MSQTILYARISTTEQSIADQRKQAEAAGLKFDDVVTDDGVSGIATRLVDRAQGRRRFDMLRRETSWWCGGSIYLAGTPRDVTDTIREFMRRGVIIRTVINNLTLDRATTDPIQQAVRDALIAFMAASALKLRQSPAKRRSGPDRAREGQWLARPRPQAVVRSPTACHCAGSAWTGGRAGGDRQGNRVVTTDGLSDRDGRHQGS